MAKETVKKFDYGRLKRENPLLYRQLQYEIACLFVKERLNYSQIRKEIYKRAGDSKSQYHEYYDKNGEVNIKGSWVPRRIEDAIRNNFILLGSFRENILSKNIREHIDNAKKASIKIAPDEELLLRQVCIDFDKILIEKIKSISADKDKKVVVGVSGGNTMLALAQTFHDIKTLMDWHKIASDEDKDKVVVCSLTSGGTRDNIGALSDTVAANIAQELGVKAKGLLGPPSFEDKTAHDAFKNEPEVQKHIQLVEKAEIILTSVGDVHDDTALTSQIFKVVDQSHLNKIRKEHHEHLGDMLYQCYDGDTGEIIPPSQEILDRIFLAITLLDLRRKVIENQKKVIENQTRCIIVAKGYNKGKHALRGAIMRRLASDIYMDLKCAQGLSDIAEQMQE